MFTGLVQTIGTVTAVQDSGDARRIDVDLGAPVATEFGGTPRIGDSIALSGVCCTVVELTGHVAAFDLSAETLARTWLGQAVVGDWLNVEPALRAGDPLGGHLVQGHVDGVGEVTAAIDPAAGGEFAVRVPAELRRYCVEKGSITLDGVSLTIAGPPTDVVKIAVIPHTAAVTTLGSLPVGRAIHVEVDVLAKYVENLLAARGLGGGLATPASE
ncbi:MAG: riboflavin synthase [bacterium]|nr:riboflavin synthase [bacterium]